jgi:signal transduction histidine kinase
MAPRGWSIRVRDTLIATVLSAFVLSGTGVVADLYIRAAAERRGVRWAGDDHWLEVAITAPVLALIGLVAWVTWWMVGRTLGPIEVLRTELAAISATDLSRRVPESSRGDEIARIAATVHETLERLDDAMNRQGRFAADVSHELRTPIAGLRAGLEEALMLPDEVDPYAALEVALRETGRLEAIVADLLLLARLGVGTAQHMAVDLADLVAAEVGRRDTEVRTALAPGVIVNAVPTQLMRLLDNLLDNAECFAEKEIDVEVAREDGTAVLTVTDDGPGIPVADRERVFERFTRLGGPHGRDTGGTGLGLAIARDIARAHSGTLRVEDSPRGARFVLRLRAAAQGESV